MLIWIGCAVLTAAVVAVMVRPLLREDSDQDALNSQAADLAVYRDQLVEIEGDQARGLIEATEADAAKAELSRRILRHADTNPKHSDTSQSQGAAVSKGPSANALSQSSQAAVYALALFVPLASVAGYVMVGAPNLPAQPYASRLNKSPAASNVAELVAQVEARLRTHPKDGIGWELIAPIYYKQRRFDDASQAYANVIRLLGETPKRLQGLGQARVMANDGQVGPIAQKAFEKIIEKQPDNIEARFWLAVSKEQAGDLKDAIAAYESLLSSADEKAPWREVVAKRLTETKSKAGLNSNANLTTDKGQKAAAGSSETKQPVYKSKAFPDGVPPYIVAMVEGLAKKLQADGKNFKGWMQLISSYNVMGRDGDAKAASVEAKKYFPEGTPEAIKIDELLAELKLKD